MKQPSGNVGPHDKSEVVRMADPGVSLRHVLLIAGLLTARSEPSYAPDPASLLGEYSGSVTPGGNLSQYTIAVALEEITDSISGRWYLSYQATCATEDGPLRGSLSGDELTLRLLPDQDLEGTYVLRLRVAPGDSVLRGSLTAEVNNGTLLCGLEADPLDLRRGETGVFP